MKKISAEYNKVSPKYVALLKEMNRMFQTQEKKAIQFVKDRIGGQFYDVVMDQIKFIRESYKSDNNNCDFQPIGNAPSFAVTMKNFTDKLERCKNTLIDTEQKMLEKAKIEYASKTELLKGQLGKREEFTNIEHVLGEDQAIVDEIESTLKELTENFTPRTLQAADPEEPKAGGENTDQLGDDDGTGQLGDMGQL